jgi:hypothetical protein
MVDFARLPALARMKDPCLDQRTAYSTGETGCASAAGGARVLSRADVRDGVDFASRQAARGKMRLWVAAFTALAAIVVLVVVSVSVLHAS